MPRRFLETYFSGNFVEKDPRLPMKNPKDSDFFRVKFNTRFFSTAQLDPGDAKAELRAKLESLLAEHAKAGCHFFWVF